MSQAEEIALLLQKLQEDPEDSQVMVILALIYNDNSDYEKALELLTLAAQLQDIDGIYQLARMYEKGEHKGAPNYEKAMELYTSICLVHPDACYDLAYLYFSRNKKGDWEQAFLYYSQYLEFQKSTSLPLNTLQKANTALGLIQEHKGAYKEAVNFYKTSITLGNSEAAVRLADLYARNGPQNIHNFHMSLNLYNSVIHSTQEINTELLVKAKKGKELLLKKEVEIFASASPDLKNLYDKLKEMQDYGKECSKSDNKKGDLIINLSCIIENKILSFMEHSIFQPNTNNIDQEIARFIKDIEDLIECNKPKLQSQKWQVIAANFLIALTGVGFLMLWYKTKENATKNKETFSRTDKKEDIYTSFKKVLFYSEQKSNELTDELKTNLNKIDADTFNIKPGKK